MARCSSFSSLPSWRLHPRTCPYHLNSQTGKIRMMLSVISCTVCVRRGGEKYGDDEGGVSIIVNLKACTSSTVMSGAG